MSFLRIILVGLCFGAVARSGMETVRPVTGFAMPRYDAAGRLRSELRGERGYLLPGGDIRIIHLTAEVFEADGTTLRVTSPECTYRERLGSVESTARISIVRSDSMFVTGEGYHWDAENERLTIHQHAHVVLVGRPEPANRGGDE